MVAINCRWPVILRYESVAKYVPPFYLRYGIDAQIYRYGWPVTQHSQ